MEDITVPKAEAPGNGELYQSQTDPELSKRIKNHRRGLKLSLATMGLGAAIGISASFTSLIQHPQEPGIYDECSSMREQVSHLERARKELAHGLGSEEDPLFSQLGQSIDTRRERISQMEREPEFQKYQDACERLDRKTHIALYGGLGLLVLGYAGLLTCYFSRAGKTRIEQSPQHRIIEI